MTRWPVPVTHDREIEWEGVNLSIIDALASFALDLEWDDGSADADGREVYPAGWSITSLTLCNIYIEGRRRSRKYLADLIGEDGVAEIEDAAREDIDPNAIIQEAAA